jgi:hypothetical protein
MPKLWIGNQPEPDDRTIIEVSSSDLDRIGNLDRNGKDSVRVKDLLTKKPVTLTRISCGLDCKCALGFVAKGKRNA